MNFLIASNSTRFFFFKSEVNFLEITKEYKTILPEVFVKVKKGVVGASPMRQYVSCRLCITLHQMWGHATHVHVEL